MIKPKDWEAAPKYNESRSLPAGGYVCVILKAEETVSKSSGNPMVNVYLDIAEGEYAKFFNDKFKRNHSPDKAKWGCISYIPQFTKEGSTAPAFKSFVCAVEDSNNGFHVSWDDTFCEKLKGKRLGVVFEREEFEDRNGKPRWTTKPSFGRFKTVEQVHEGDYTTPEDKPLKKPNVTYSDGSVPAGFEVIPDEDVPF